MSANEFYKPVGGILAAELFLTRDLSSIEDLATAQPIAVELVDDGSLYEEHFTQENGLVSVSHTLTLRSNRVLAEEWFSVELMQILAVEGAVARVQMATGEQITIGYSPRMGFNQALRLESLSFSSGEKPCSSPCVELKLHSRDLCSALSNGN